MVSIFDVRVDDGIRAQTRLLRGQFNVGEVSGYFWIIATVLQGFTGASGGCAAILQFMRDRKRVEPGLSSFRSCACRAPRRGCEDFAGTQPAPGATVGVGINVGSGVIVDSASTVGVGGTSTTPTSPAFTAFSNGAYNQPCASLPSLSTKTIFHQSPAGFRPTILYSLPMGAFPTMS